MVRAGNSNGEATHPTLFDFPLCPNIIVVFFIPFIIDYCDIFLTHDAKRVRKDHDSGWKHAAQVRAHFLASNQDKMGRTISEIIKVYGQRKGNLWCIFICM